MRGARPISSSAVRVRPNSCTSSAPKLDAPTFRDPDRQVGDGCYLGELFRPGIDRPQIPVEREAVHRDDIERGRARPVPAMLEMKFGSIGEMPPSTRGRPGASAAIASPASRHMRAKRDQSGSSSGSQCDLLFGSFQIIAASIMPQPPSPRAAAMPDRPRHCRRAAARTADINLLLRIAVDDETRRCAASPSCRPGSAPTNSCRRRHSGAR